MADQTNETGGSSAGLLVKIGAVLAVVAVPLTRNCDDVARLARVSGAADEVAEVGVLVGRHADEGAGVAAARHLAEDAGGVDLVGRAAHHAPDAVDAVVLAGEAGELMEEEQDHSDLVRPHAHAFYTAHRDALPATTTGAVPELSDAVRFSARSADDEGVAALLADCPDAREGLDQTDDVAVVVHAAADGWSFVALYDADARQVGEFVDAP